MMFNRRRLLFAALNCGLISSPATGLLAQTATPSTTQQTQPATGQGQDSGQGQEADPLKRQLSDKERYRAQKNLRGELKGPYKKWLDEDVPYIITDDERKAFLSLANDEEREAFIENFWLRRNPNPDSPENEFREEHYRRIQYANDHYAAGKPGWKSDRGHIYIAFGAPDSIDSHPSGGMYERPPEEGGGEPSTFPFEIWHYRYIEGIGENVDIEFVDTCQCGDYHYTIDRSEKDALKNVPGAGMTDYEEKNHAGKNDRFNGNGIEQLGAGNMATYNQSHEFDRIAMAVKLFAPPANSYADLSNDLDAFSSSHKLLQGPVFPFDVRTDYVKVTDGMDLIPITIQIRNRDITFNIEPNLQTSGDPKLLRIALENLLGNAVKLSSRMPTTVVDFGWDKEKKAWFVRDNGAGFDMFYADKLFTAFNRLHGDKDFKGSGIGLATVARVIHRHHGDIWADSVINHGATFWFTLG